MNTQPITAISIRVGTPDTPGSLARRRRACAHRISSARPDPDAQPWPSWRGSLSSTLSQDTWLLVHM
jgi:hypothetical protein